MIYNLFYNLILRFLDAEFAHKIAIFALKFMPSLKAQKQEVEFFGYKINNKVGIAAGFDKNGEAIKGLFNIGFGFVEIGTVTPKPQQGNPKPRVFRVGNKQGIINRMGFPNLGSATVLENLRKFNSGKQSSQVVGVNIGRNKEGTEEDYLTLIEQFIEEADYITINISSPNTPGLRNLLEEKPLSSFLSKIQEKRESLATKKPFFLKISPDLEVADLTFIYRLLVEHKIEGIIISNTTITRPSATLKNLHEAGGLSGRLVAEKSLTLLKAFNKLNKSGIIVISVGGISTKEDVEIRLANGANFVQIYTSFAFNGPSIISRLIG